jgi:branched-chain amino acid transport system permease protein
VSKFAALQNSRARKYVIPLVGLFLLAIPFIQPRDVQTTLTSAVAYAIAAIGLTILVGVGGQLSLAHGVFIAAGAYGYIVLAGDPAEEGKWGLGLPPVLAAIGGVVIAALLGLIFSPVAARLKGLYLGMASLALIFVSEYVFTYVTPLTGGLQGRSVPQFDIFGLELSGSTKKFIILGANIDGIARLWFIAVIALFIAVVVALRIVRGRPGQALRLVRDNPTAAAAIGVNVQHAKAEAFVVSSAYAGVAGVFVALYSQVLTPETFDIVFSINFLAMIIIGGLGSIGGAVFGGAFVALLAFTMNKLGGTPLLPFIDQTGLNGIPGGTFSTILFGVIVVLILIFEPGGAAGIMRRIRARKKSSQVAPPQQPQNEDSREAAPKQKRKIT